MSETTPGTLHPLAPEHLPYFIPRADGSDVMFWNVVVFVLILAFAAGTLYLRLHSLPERMAHGASRTQLQLVAILAVIALFTHESLFWIAALLLAAAQIPDFLTPITSGARSLAQMTQRPYEGDLEPEGAGHAPEPEPRSPEKSSDA
jgi:hypothetical protein